MLDIENKPLLKNAPFWSWNDKLNKEECKRQIEEMHKAGWGSFFMHARVGLITPYLSDEWMDLCRYCAEEAEKLGMKAWLYDEDKWPSGYAGGKVALKEENRQRELVLIKKEEIGENDTILMEYNYRGNTHYICKRITGYTYGGWFNGYAYVDLMNPDTVKDFLESTHEKYKEAMGDKFGKSIPGIFTDEPNYLFYVDGVTKVQWTDRLPEVFKDKYGYDLMENLHKLFFDVDNYTQVRYDFYYITTEMFKEAFTHQYYDWCNENGMIFTGHFMCEDYLWFQTQWSGDVMSHYEYMTWPGVDKLFTHLKQNATFKQVSSVSEQLGKERTFAEIFALMGNHTSFLERKWVGDWQSILGSNFINSHLSLYSMRGERKRDCPANYYYQQPWWDEEKYLGDYFARTCAFGTEGYRPIDLLVLQPLTSVWCEYSPLQAKYEYGQVLKYDKPYEQLTERFMDEKLDYHLGNENIMKKYASVKGDKLAVGKCEYSVVYVPNCSNIMKSTYNLLKEFSANGGKLIFTNELPYMLEGVKCDLSFENYEVVRDVEDAISVLNNYIKNDIEILEYFRADKINARKIWCEKRIVGNSERYFLANTNKDRKTKVKIILKNCQNVALYDLMTGKIYNGDSYCIENENSKEFHITFAPAGSLLIVTGKEAEDAKEKCPLSFASGVDFVEFKNLVLECHDFDKCNLLNENLLVLNDATIKIGDKTESGCIYHLFLNSFVNAKEGTPFELEYNFESKADILNAFACIDAGENLDEIIFNGEKVSCLKNKGEYCAYDSEKNWLDPGIAKIKLSKIKKGINSLVLKGVKRTYINDFPIDYDKFVDVKPTDCEDVYILGDFSLERAGDGKFVMVETKTVKGNNITTEGAPFYVGKVKINKTVNINLNESKKYWIKFINAKKSSAEVIVNGKSCGVSVMNNDAFDITEAIVNGKNEIEIIFATTLYNCFGPTKAYEGRGISIDGGMFLFGDHYEDKYNFEDYGLESFCIYEM